MNYLKKNPLVFGLILALIFSLTSLGVFINTQKNNKKIDNQLTPVLEVSQSLQSSISSETIFESSSTKPQKRVLGSIELPILMYHRIDTLTNISKSDIYRPGLSVSPEAFDKQMEFLKKNNYNTVTSQDLREYMDDDKKDLPKKPIWLTFDDGFMDAYTKALPILKKYEQKGEFGIITGFVGSSDYMGWAELKELQKQGMGISSHTHYHCYLASKNIDKKTQSNTPFLKNPVNEKIESCPQSNFGGQLTTGQMKYELEQSKSDLEKNLNIKVNSIIYPYGYYNQQVLEAAKDIGYTLGTTVEPQEISKANFTQPLNLKRTRINGQQDTTLKGFFAK